MKIHQVTYIRFLNFVIKEIYILGLKKKAEQKKVCL